MQWRWLVAFLFVFSLGLSACAEIDITDQPVASDEADETLTTQEQALEGGCRQVCPRCRPGQVCAMFMCYLECNGQGGGNGAQHCQTDDDCVAHSNYCGGCECLAANVNSQFNCPTSDLVYCLMDPCGSQEAFCNQQTNQCELAPALATE